MIWQNFYFSPYIFRHKNEAEKYIFDTDFYVCFCVYILCLILCLFLRGILCLNNFLGGIELKDVIVGEDVAKLRQMLEVTYPMENGIVRNWEDMERLWDHTFSEEILDVDPNNAKILLTEAPMNPKKNREKLIQTMFEKYGFQGM